MAVWSLINLIDPPKSFTLPTPSGQKFTNICPVVELLWGRIELERDECVKGCLSLVAGRVMLTRIRVWTLKE
jgi:hypothetical protein